MNYNYLFLGIHFGVFMMTGYQNDWKIDFFRIWWPIAMAFMVTIGTGFVVQTIERVLG